MKSRVIEMLMVSGYKHVVDKTHFRRGSLWVITDRPRELDSHFFARLNREIGTNFVYAASGGRSTYHRAAWFWVPGHRPGMRLGPGILEDGPYAGV